MIAIIVYDTEIYEDYDEHFDNTVSNISPVTSQDGEEAKNKVPAPTPKQEYTPCDKKSTLYVSNENKIMEYNTIINSNYSNPFYIKKIPKSNLFLVIILTDSENQPDEIQPPLKPEQIIYGPSFPCYKLNMSFFERRRLEECFVEHANVMH